MVVALKAGVVGIPSVQEAIWLAWPARVPMVAHVAFGGTWLLLVRWGVRC